MKDINYIETLLNIHNVIYLTYFSWHEGTKESETESIIKTINNFKLATKLCIALFFMHI